MRLETDQKARDLHPACVGSTRAHPAESSVSLTSETKLTGGVGHPTDDPHQRRAALCGAIVEQYRRRRDFLLPEGDTVRRIKALCRRYARHVEKVGKDGRKFLVADLADRNVLAKAVLSTTGAATHPQAERVRAHAHPLLAALGIIREARKLEERTLIQLAGQLPVHEWWCGHRGLSALGLAAIVGEAGDLSNYANPAKLWKRLGLDVWDDGRAARRSRDKTKAASGYSPMRRAAVWGIGDPMIRAKGDYYPLYIARKAKAEAEGWGQSQKHRHNDAKRRMEKQIVLDLWKEWHRLAGPVQRCTPKPDVAGGAGHHSAVTQRSFARPAEPMKAVPARMRVVGGAGTR